MPSSPDRVCIIGLGNFGYALLKHLDQEVHSYQLMGWDNDPRVRKSFITQRSHPRLHTHHRISSDVTIIPTLAQAITQSTILVLAVPSAATREILPQIRKHLTPGTILVNTAKALDHQTGKRLSRIYRQQLTGKHYGYAMLAGGTIARDLFEREPLGMTVASEKKAVLSRLVSIFQSPSLRVYPTTDLTGVEYASAFKNAVSILAGIIKGMGFSYGSETHIISRVAGEIEELVTTKLGGKKSTFAMHSQCWGNDLWMSCTGSTRNREFGILLGSSGRVDQALATMRTAGKTIEGINTVAALARVIPRGKYSLLHFLNRFIITRTATLDDLRSILYSFNF